ncbi:tail fiber protein [Pectobacterium phage Arno160]|uniref:Tail spike n=1 Tax=Pectobacterium phage Arno160 TaxID=2488835 RepID=A0A3G8F1X9_9CAUD|nr:tail fiber protein [Pectobacterium phage Arno160]AZF88104.1 tail spike [Pectobacterium phage Arno160]
MADITQQWFDATSVGADYKTMHIWEGDGDELRAFELNFTGGYINQSDVKSFMVKTTTQERTDLEVSFVGSNTVTLSEAVPVGYRVTIYRDTNKLEPLAKFSDGAIITANNLDRNSKQAIFAVAEMVDRFDSVTDTANEAIATAYASLAKSEQAVEYSTEALDIANSTFAAADRAEAAAAASAESAQQSATASEEAVTTANGIAGTANQALSNSETALGTANNIAGTANTALTNSEDALNTAQAAQATASGIETRTLRVSSGSLNPLAPVGTAENKIVVIRGGQPVWEDPAVASGDVLSKLGVTTGASLVGTPYGGNLSERMALLPYNRKGALGSGVVLQSGDDVVTYNGMFYQYTGTFPHTSSETTVTGYRCLGLLNGWPLNHTRNWGIVPGSSNHTEALQLMVANSLPDTTLISDGQAINIAGLQLTTTYPSVKFKGFRFAPFYVSGATSVDVMINITRGGIVMEDVTFNKPATGLTVTSAIQATDALNLRFDRISSTGTGGTYSTYFRLFNVKESGFSNLRIDLDPSNMGGTLIESNYCVNNTFSDSFVGFGQYGLRCTSVVHPTNSYASEGWLVDNVVAVFFDNPLYMQRVTAANITNCVFDFCGTRGYEFTLGGHNLISNCWFANRATSSTTNPFCVVAGTTHEGLTLSNCDFVNNNGINTSPLFSHNGLAAQGTKVVNCRSKSFAEGVILHAASALLGNTFYNSGAATYNVAARNTLMGNMRLENKSVWAAGSTFTELQLSNGIQSAGIRGRNSSISDRAGMDMYTTLGGVQNVVLRLIDDNITMPRLPATLEATIVGGLYAGEDGIIRIRRT